MAAAFDILSFKIIDDNHCLTITAKLLFGNLSCHHYIIYTLDLATYLRVWCIHYYYRHIRTYMYLLFLTNVMCCLWLYKIILLLTTSESVFVWMCHQPCTLQITSPNGPFQFLKSVLIAIAANYTTQPSYRGSSQVTQGIIITWE